MPGRNNFLGNKRREPSPDNLWDDDVPISPDHPLVPEAIRQAVEADRAVGDSLHRVQTEDGIEWWLFDLEGELIEAYWLEGNPRD